MPRLEISNYRQAILSVAQTSLGATILIPSSMVDSMNIGGVMGLAGAAALKASFETGRTRKVASATIRGALV